MSPGDEGTHINAEYGEEHMHSRPWACRGAIYTARVSADARHSERGVGGYFPSRGISKEGIKAMNAIESEPVGLFADTP